MPFWHRIVIAAVVLLVVTLVARREVDQARVEILHLRAVARDLVDELCKAPRNGLDLRGRRGELSRRDAAAVAFDLPLELLLALERGRVLLPARDELLDERPHVLELGIGLLRREVAHGLNPMLRDRGGRSRPAAAARDAAGIGEAPIGTSAARPATRLSPFGLKKSVIRGAVVRLPPIVPRGTASSRSSLCVGLTTPAMGAVPSRSVVSPARTTMRARSVSVRVSTAPTVSGAGAPPGPAMSP